MFGAVAVIVAIWAPKGLWGAIRRRSGIELFPVGNRLTVPAAAHQRRPTGRGAGSQSS